MRRCLEAFGLRILGLSGCLELFGLPDGVKTVWVSRAGRPLMLGLRGCLEPCGLPRGPGMENAWVSRGFWPPQSGVKWVSRAFSASPEQLIWRTRGCLQPFGLTEEGENRVGVSSRLVLGF